ncbi:protein PHLOEM PROTEIN 2-LIKE A9-like [Salvia divinorum]|uniref:Protein PHLOEM PROTEIN 2-LIKE A9-like n=1 Tax=Salvia divinorum TaxID=28513 RepID=A0ABD1I1D6_SALDI
MSTPNPHHVGAPSLELELVQKRMEIKPKDLSIVWGKDNRYWSVSEDGAAELYQVSWLEVTGCVSKTDPDKKYEVGFRISLTADAFGWSGSPVYILVKRGKTAKFKGHKFSLDTPKDNDDIKAEIDPINIPTTDEDADAKEENSKVYFGLYEVWRGKWKGGLKIHHAFIQEIVV